MAPFGFLLVGYVFTVLVETPILLLLLSPRHPVSRRLFAGAWLTACTFPVVVLVWPFVFDPTTERVLYLLCAESFAPIAECLLFWLAFGSRQEFGKWSMGRDFGAIVLANLASFGLGELLYSVGAADVLASWGVL